MTDLDYKNLENLLDKLRSEIGFDYCVIPVQIQDGYHIGIYNQKGEIASKYTWYKLKTAVAVALEKMKNP